MIKAFLMLIIAGSACSESFADDDAYAVNKIPPELLKNANAVKRSEEIIFEVVNKSKARLYRKVAYTILNQKGDRFAHCLEEYDKLQSVEYIEGTLFDENGNKIKALKKSDIQDRSSSDDNNLADDNRVKFHSFYHRIYPYTVEYITENRFSYTMFYPGWIAQEDELLSVESGKMSVILPEGYDLRYKTFNFSKEPLVSSLRSSRMYTWEVKSLAACQREFASPHWYEITPVVCMGPKQFAVEGYEGNMATWQDFGKFVYALKAGRDQLPANIKKIVHDLTDNLTDTTKKIATLYDFLQKNTRYVSVQLGVGGWQPFNAEYVASNRYGDCKALTNYMYSLLKEAGIRSNYTLVKAGEGKTFFISDFPSSQFNHVILSVPLQKDTVWLECTSQTLPPGYLSGFTCDRNVLIIDESGGKLARTPKYNITDNLQVRKITATLNEEGNLAAHVETMYRARQEDDIHSLINNNSKKELLEHLKKDIDLPNYDIVDFNYKEQKTAVPSITENLNINAGNYAQITGRRLFLSPNILSRTNLKLPVDDARRFDIDFHYEYTDIDSVEINIPAGYTPEAIPKDITLETRYGKYSCTVKVINDKIYYCRDMQQFSGRFPAKDYGELVKFYDAIYKADRNKMVLVKKD